MGPLVTPDPRPAGARLAAFVGASAVGLGAFGAHGLKQRVDDSTLLAIWETAARYHLIHAVVILVWVWTGGPRLPVRFWSAGILIFSGTLYLLVLTNLRWLGAITPLGGLLLIAGWVATAWRRRTT